MLSATLPLRAQVAAPLPAFTPATQGSARQFTFISDGPRGPGWSRPNQIARVYFDEQLPTFFCRSIELSDPLPDNASLVWIFTGPHAGFTITLSATQVRLTQRYYDSTGLEGNGGGYPQRITKENAHSFTGAARSLEVIVDAHLSVNVLVNGDPLLTQHLVFDVTRHQLMLDAPRNRHIVVAGRLLREPRSLTTLIIDPADRHQTMIGFGGSPSIPAYASLSDKGKQIYWDILRRYNLLIDREYPMGEQLKPDLSNIDNLADATPHYYGDNFPNGEVSSFDYSLHTLDLGGSVIYEMWALPKWAVVPWQPPAGSSPVYDAWHKQVHSAADPETYARIVVGYCKLLKERSGAAPLVVGIQNEIEQPPNVFARMTTVLRRELDRAGFQSTQIHMADAPFVYMAIDRVKALRADPAAWNDTNFIAAHQYDYQQFLSNPDLYDTRLQQLHAASDGKPFLATEICLNDPHAQEPSFRLAFQVGQLYQKDLTITDAETLLYCWLLLDVEQPTFGGSRSLLVPGRTDGDIPVPSSFQLRVLGAWSRHIRRGMTRITVHSSDPDILATAFTGDNNATMVIMNRSIHAQEIKVEWPGAPHWRQLERTSTYLANQTTTLNADAPLLVQPGEIVTLTTENTQ
ncbi:MAG TPA: hypothetical protein VHY48_13695 [Acidobacteriaceae bacterium]|jgi:O-glycosyl hydrolase|nr:hypothetical protein [Acidobacteriaceae bacterium]